VNNIHVSLHASSAFLRCVAVLGVEILDKEQVKRMNRG